jgi:hypothetical protein
MGQWHRFLYPAALNIHKTDTSMLPAGFEPAVPAGERSQTFAFDSVAIGISNYIPSRHVNT